MSDNPIKPRHIRYRKEYDKVLLFNVVTRSVVILSELLFEAWKNLDTLKIMHAQGTLSTSSYSALLNFFRDNHLIEQGERYI